MAVPPQSPTMPPRVRKHRRAIPTRAGLFVLFSPLALGMAAVSASNNLLFLLLAVALGSIVLSGMLSEANIKGVKVSLQAVSAAYVGEPCHLEVRYRRPPKLAPAFGLRVRELKRGRYRVWGARPAAPDIVDAFLPVLDKGSARVTCRRRFTTRGLAQLSRCELTTRFPFGLLNKARDVAVHLDVVVRPRRIAVPSVLEDPHQNLGEGDRSNRRGLGTEIYGLRERQEWDEAHRVHALRSMALGRDVVLETSQVERPTAWLGVAATVSAEPEALERALEVASAALVAWQAQGFAVGLALPGLVHPPGDVNVEGLLDALAAVEPQEFSTEHAKNLPSLWLVPTGARVPGAERRVISVDAQDGLGPEGAG